MAREKIDIERALRAPVEEVWECFTTREGIEAWWGGSGYRIGVRALDVRAGGILELEMTATGPVELALLLKWKLPVTSVVRMNFREVEAPAKLSFRQRIDYVPGVPPYDVTTQVELARAGRGTRLHLTSDGLHDAAWSQRALAGWEQQLDALAAKLG